MNKQTLGQRIAAERKKLNISQEALGEKMGVSRQAISKWEADGALPEIDKLIAMSKLFGVTLGWLMGLEEGSGQQTADFSEEQLELIRRMIPQPPQPRKAPWIAATIFSAAALVIALFSRPAVPNYTGEINRLQNELQALKSTVSSMVYQQEAMMEENAEMLLLAHDINFAGIQDDGTARVIFTAVPKEWTPGQTASLSVLRDGKKVAEAPCTIDGAVCTATVDLPLEDGYEYRIVTTDAEGGQKFQCLDGGECTYLKTDTSLQVESWIIPNVEYRRNTLNIIDMELSFSRPGLGVEDGTVEWTQMDYVIRVNGGEVRRESFLEADMLDEMEFGFSVSRKSFSDIALENGDEVTLAVEAALSSGQSESLTMGVWTFQNGKLN